MPDRIFVRKILSEALTAVSWNPSGEGVMLPPFAKARKQAEFLQALPASVKRYFPEVYAVLEREIPVPAHLRKDGRETYRELIYEMSYVEGDEVSRFIEKHVPPPQVIARLYKAILILLRDRIHTLNRVPAPGDTLNVSYFRKIEDRLALCREVAPATFNDALLDTDRIVINDVVYQNVPELLRVFRERRDFREILEPRFHSLVMGDTNTENIKIGDTSPLLTAQRLIEAGAPADRIDRALAEITADTLMIRFLDPRAIGFESDGRTTRDDPMYDNKPWHNSLGHYDEIHYEHFDIEVETGIGRTPRIDIAFQPDNPFRRAYRVRDVAATGGRVDMASPRGMEDFFAPVMESIYGTPDDGGAHGDDPYWLVRFVFIMGTHFAAMPPFHFQTELDGTLNDTYQVQRRPIAIYCEGVKWLNWAVEILEGRRSEFLGVKAPRPARPVALEGTVTANGPPRRPDAERTYGR